MLAAGVLTVAFEVARHAPLPELVDDDQLTVGNGRLAINGGLALVGGPAVAGLAVQLLGASITVLAQSIGYATAAMLVAGIPRNRSRAEPERQDHGFRQLAGPPRSGGWCRRR